VQIERAIGRGLAPGIDSEYLAAASIGIAREVGERMLERPDTDVSHACAFCADLILHGASRVPEGVVS
jgi:hypothetical protein